MPSRELDMTAFGRRLALRIQRKRLNPRRLEQRSGVSATYIRDLIRGDAKSVGLSKLHDLARGLDVDLIDLVADAVGPASREVPAELNAVYGALEPAGRRALWEIAHSLKVFQDHMLPTGVAADDSDRAVGLVAGTEPVPAVPFGDELDPPFADEPPAAETMGDEGDTT